MRSLEIVIEKVLIHGKKYIPAMVPDGIERGKVGDCFDHTLVQAMLNPELKYVEGIARRPSTNDWVVHAWLTDGVSAFDLTWGMYYKDGIILPLSTDYIGIEMDSKKVAEFYMKTKYKSVLWNGWRDEEKSEKLLGFNFK